ncbi:hypothetical protein GGS21DRAFT_309271 [Xylaria nigripes]|nr:hypothetical protein GGS21DRAFT_309271 [Xylaria nigripes]
MALAAAYQQFLASPNPSYLTENATLNYITTTTVFRGSSDIIQHLNTMRRQVKKKKENLLSVVHGQSAIAAEIETSLEFVTSGASYVPSLDDNFLADRTVSLPIMHIVTFDDDGKVVNIRQSWDQGALLKQLDVMGKTGRNWPIRDSTDQIKMIENCVKSVSGTSPADSQPPAGTPNQSRSKNPTRDPHASLSLFESREELEGARSAVVSPRGGAKPRQRNFVEILGDEPVDEPDSPSIGRNQSASPNQAVAPRGGQRPRQRDFAEILGDEPVEGSDFPDSNDNRSRPAPKAGAGKNFPENRLFEKDEGYEEPSEDIITPNRFYRPHPKKYSHFEFTDEPDKQDTSKPLPDPVPLKAKHTSQWSFEDFVTPEKVKPSKTLRQQQAQGWELGNNDNSGIPPVQAKSRRGPMQNNGHDLYQNNLFDEEGNGIASSEGKQPLGAITNQKDRSRNFDAHWTITDNPSPEKPRAKVTVSDDRQKAVKMMEPNWSTYDESPVKKENKPSGASNGSKMKDDRGISISGDGMGGGKGSTRDWLYGSGDNTQTVEPVPGKKLSVAKSGGFNGDF